MPTSHDLTNNGNELHLALVFLAESSPHYETFTLVPQNSIKFSHEKFYRGTSKGLPFELSIKKRQMI